MNHDSQNPIGRCGFCEQGHLHLYRCPRCSAVVAICDECELIWDDVTAVHADPSTASDSAFPQCPRCHARNEFWQPLTRPEIERGNLNHLLREPEEG